MNKKKNSMVSNNGNNENKYSNVYLFDIYSAKNNIDYPFAEIRMFQKDWNTTIEKKVVSTHPLLEEITIIAQGFEIIASPFKKMNPKEDENRNSNLKDIKDFNNKTILQIKLWEQFLLKWLELRRIFQNQIT